MKKQLFLILLTALLAACGADDASEIEMPAPATKEEAPDTLTNREPQPQPRPTNNAAARAERKAATEDKLMQMVLDLEEVRQLDEEVRKKTGGKHRVRTMIAAEPDNDREYYTVTAGEDNGASVVTIYEFHIYPDMSIEYYDIVEDREMTLEEWRKQKK